MSQHFVEAIGHFVNSQSSSTVWDSGIELWLSGSGLSAFTC